MLSLRVGIPVIQFVVLYLKEYHQNLIEGVDSKSADAYDNIIKLAGASYSKITMLSSFIKFLSSMQADEQDSAYLQKIHEDLEINI